MLFIINSRNRALFRTVLIFFFERIFVFLFMSQHIKASGKFYKVLYFSRMYLPGFMAIRFDPFSDYIWLSNCPAGERRPSQVVFQRTTPSNWKIK